MKIQLKITKCFEPDCRGCKLLSIDKVFDDLGFGQVQVAESTSCNCNNLEEECPEVQRHINDLEPLPDDWEIDEIEVEDD